MNSVENSCKFFVPDLKRVVCDQSKLLNDRIWSYKNIICSWISLVIFNDLRNLAWIWYDDLYSNEKIFTGNNFFTGSSKNMTLIIYDS